MNTLYRPLNHATGHCHAGCRCPSCAQSLESVVQHEGVLFQEDEVSAVSAPAWDVAQLRQAIARVALQELGRWRAGGRQRTEREPDMLPILQDYWRNGAGLNFTQQQLASEAFQDRYPWSATFISWVMRRAGAGSYFTYAAAHTRYVAAAKRNRVQNLRNPFYAFRANEVRPEVGDLVCAPRANSGVTYDNVSSQSSHCDVVTAVRQGEITVVGGNVRDQTSGVANTVGEKRIPLDARGFLRHPSNYYAIVKIVPAAGGASPSVTPQPAPVPPRPILPSNPAIPRLVGSETSPPMRSLFFQIDLQAVNHDGSRAPTVTGVYLPPNFQWSSALNVILYLHGFKGNQTRTSIRSTWNAPRGPQAALREAVQASGRNVLFVAPTLGTRSSAGWLTTRGGLDRFLGMVIGGLANQIGINMTPALARLVLACHSGGGKPMRDIAAAHNLVASRIRECWGFDSMYNRGHDRFWAEWASNRPGSRVFVYYLPGTQTQALSVSLANMRVPNVRVVASRARGHSLVPVAHLAERIAGM
ncbi:MAG TPA: DUF2272 domain-containing protein [Pirellulaceae bacterium]|nr:DUF2272 domain-containing protein [Pirellulaceae bacterium]